MRFGMRRLAITGLCILAVLNVAQLMALSHRNESIRLFMIVQTGSMAIFGFLGANLNTLAIEPLGHIAGTASSAIGFFTTVCGAVLGYLVSQSFDGSVIPLTLAYVVFGSSALGLVLSANRGAANAPPTRLAG